MFPHNRYVLAGIRISKGDHCLARFAPRCSTLTEQHTLDIFDREAMLCNVLHVSIWFVRQIPDDMCIEHDATAMNFGWRWLGAVVIYYNTFRTSQRKSLGGTAARAGRWSLCYDKRNFEHAPSAPLFGHETYRL